MAEDRKSIIMADQIPYKAVCDAINGLYEPDTVAEKEPLNWGRKELVRFFKRLGTIPAGYNRRKASLRVLLAAKKMASDSDTKLSTVYQGLCLFTGAGDRGICQEQPHCPRCPVSGVCKYTSRNITVKDLPSAERPRERLYATGAEELSNTELLAIILGGGSREENAIGLAKRLLATFRDLPGIENASNAELESIKGIGKAKVARLRAAFALGRRCQTPSLDSVPAVKGSRQVFEHYRHKFLNCKQEVFLCVLLDTRYRVIREEKVAEGSLTESIVHPREVFKRAVSESAYAVLFVHNHPSGDPSPSPQDHNLTDRLEKAGRLMGIRIVDHLIVGKDSYYSFAEQGKL